MYAVHGGTGTTYAQKSSFYYLILRNRFRWQTDRQASRQTDRQTERQGVDKCAYYEYVSVYLVGMISRALQ